jgi:mannose-6-phosphate isomerase-like protein (cupin superfamily)
METETIRTSHLRILNHRPADCSVREFDLPSLIGTIKRSRSWIKGELKSLILLESPGKNIILTAIHEGTEIESFQSNDSAMFQVIEGSLKFYIREEILTLGKGELMTIDEKIKYRLSTSEESVFLVTIAG